MQKHYTVSGFSDKTTSATGELTTYGRGDQMRRGALRTLLVWAIAIAILPIPVVHLLAIPLIPAGLVAGFLAYRQTWSLSKLAGSCPDCGQDQEFETSGPDVERQQGACHGCGRAMSFRAVEP